MISGSSFLIASTSTVLCAPGIVLDDTRERDQKLDEFTVGKRMAQIDAVTGRLDLFLFERNDGARQQRLDLSCPPAV